MTFDEESEDTTSDEESEGIPLNDELLNDEPGNLDQVPVLFGEAARFDPATGDQVFGSEKNMRNSNRGTTLAVLAKERPKLHRCNICELTWLNGKGGEDAAAKHPSHEMSSEVLRGTSRSLVVFTDGACPGNGTVDAKAGIGVYFGENSRYSVSEALSGLDPPTSQKAEILAVVRAFEIIRECVLPARYVSVQAAVRGQSKSVIKNITCFRTIIATDSSYVVEAVCANSPNWTKNRQGILVNKRGKIVKNSAEFFTSYRGEGGAS
ncbi:hypothetical protein EV356DRAFT_572621 [Viridothelium virens]|uniref:ribonuclease H n=1 Tax=Viridothelium virens TaxID=1048519 RepID=A0A6A6HMW0_VIRVR|nr:hypothetical protein EV356DRAFT_572621 [Viridothelium virens]